eukprot:TRINITY_DN17629_c0_g1_i2.p1 TRINITY_DN17629_c0_g1~~TRINITY_DN17629_c0_g1_i2.p1  ORF type:complete len:382 (-),score=58.32 TRINITY_DN17629_c0_g1_i2:65-1210(-)
MKGLVTRLISFSKIDTTCVRPPAVLFATAGLASTPRHPLAPALTALTTTSILPTNITLVESMDAWLGSIGTKPSSHRINLFSSASRQHNFDISSPTTFLSAPAVMDLGSVVHHLWRGAIGTGHNPHGGDHPDERGTESTRQQSFAATPRSGSVFNAEDMHVPDEDGVSPLPFLNNSNNNNKGFTTNSRVRRLNSDSTTTVPQHPPHHHMSLRTTIQSKGTFSLSLGMSTTFVHLGGRGGSSTPSAAYEGVGGGGGWGTPRRQSQSHHSVPSPDESQWGTPRGGRRRRSLIPRSSTTIMISSPAQDEEGVMEGGGHVSSPIFMASPPSPPAPPTEEHPTNGIDGVSLLLQALSCLLYTSRAHETPEHLVCRLLLEKKNETQK